jgi:hypothetical protein
MLEIPYKIMATVLVGTAIILGAWLVIGVPMNLFVD